MVALLFFETKSRTGEISFFVFPFLVDGDCAPWRNAVSVRTQCTWVGTLGKTKVALGGARKD